MTNRNTLAALLVAASAGFALTPAFAGDVFVVTGASTALTAADVKDVFLGEKQFAGSTKLTVLDNSAAQADFLSKGLKMDAARYTSLWSKKSFRDGLTPPAVRGTDGDILSAIKANPGTVGYVSKATADVKVIDKY